MYCVTYAEYTPACPAHLSSHSRPTGASPSEPAYSGQTAVSDVGSSIIPITPVGSAVSKRPASPDEYFTAAGRPARSASLKKVRYATDCDKDGNPIKTKEEKAAEKEKQRLRKEKEKAKKAEEKAARRSASASGSKSSVEPQSASAEASSSRSASASTVPSTSGAARAAETTRSGRQVTAPIDRHRSAAREAKASARKRQLQALQVREEREDEDTESEPGDEEEDESSREIASATTEASRNDKSDEATGLARKNSGRQAEAAPQPSASTSSNARPLRPPPINDDRDEMDLLEMSDEEDAPPVKAASRKKSSEVTQARPRTEAGNNRSTTAASPTTTAPVTEQSKAPPVTEPSAKQRQANERETAAADRTQEQAREQASASNASPSGQSRSSPMTPSAAVTRPGITPTRAETPEDSARRSFSGKGESRCPPLSVGGNFLPRAAIFHYTLPYQLSLLFSLQHHTAGQVSGDALSYHRCIQIDNLRHHPRPHLRCQERTRMRSKRKCWQGRRTDRTKMRMTRTSQSIILLRRRLKATDSLGRQGRGFCG